MSALAPIIAYLAHTLIASKIPSLRYLSTYITATFLFILLLPHFAVELGPAVHRLDSVFIAVLLTLDLYALFVGLPDSLLRRSEAPTGPKIVDPNDPFVAHYNKQAYNVRTYRGSKGASKELYLHELKQKNKFVKEFDQKSLKHRQYAQELDSKWSHVTKKQQFFHPEGKIYFCGNSLGLQPVRTRTYINEELDKWAEHGVDGHFIGERPWFEIESFLVDKMAQVVGAKPVEVAIMNSLTTNVHLLMVPFYRPTPKRFKILIEENPFPSDMYVVTSQIRFHGYNPEEALVQIGPRPGEEFIRTEDIVSFLEEEGDEIALVLLGGVQFLSGQAFDYKTITDAGHKKGCIVGFDMAHAAGNIDLQLHEYGCDFATWCTYKYLNSGPGNLSGIFVHERHAHSDLFRFAGWWGHKRNSRFQLKNAFDAQPGAAGFQLSNPPVMALMGILASLDVFVDAGIKNLREKSYRLTTYLELMLEAHISPQDMTILTPGDPRQRGCQLSVRLSRPVKEVMKRFADRGIVCDDREPDVIRLAPTPLYNTFEEVYDFVQQLKEVLEEF